MSKPTPIPMVIKPSVNHHGPAANEEGLLDPSSVMDQEASNPSASSPHDWQQGETPRVPESEVEAPLLPEGPVAETKATLLPPSETGAPAESTPPAADEADAEMESAALPEASEDSFQYLLEHWPAFSITERRERFAQLQRTEAEELFLSLKAPDQAELIAEISPLEKRSWVRMLAPDDIADLIQEMGLEHRDSILSLLDHQSRREVNALLAYAEDNAGGLMSSRFLRLRPEMSVDEAISYIRIQSRTQVETIYYAYVIDADQTLVGVVSFRELFGSPSPRKIREIMKTDLVKVPVGLDQEQVARLFSQNNLMALPVIDEWGHIKGIVTFDDIASVLQEEATEDIQKIGGLEALDAPYMKTGFFELIRKRVGWLVILFFSEMFTTSAMGFFQHEIERAVVLALFIPLIISSGGNSGSQASTLIIRALALGEVRLRDWWRVLGRELMAGFVMGLILGAIGAVRILVWPILFPSRSQMFGEHYQLVALTIFFSLIGVVLWGSVTGSMLPFILRKLKLDPATASAPFVATLVDVTGIVIYFSVASIVLAGILI